jgi:hypothetical protein
MAKRSEANTYSFLQVLLGKAGYPQREERLATLIRNARAACSKNSNDHPSTRDTAAAEEMTPASSAYDVEEDAGESGSARAASRNQS